MAEPIGSITILHGTAQAEGPDGIRELTAGDPVYNGETVSTGVKAAVEITFTDGALLSQGPNSQVHLDDYVFDPDSDAGEITIGLLEGTFRSVTGQIVDMNPEGFKIETPMSTIGIRGTTTGHAIAKGGQEAHTVLDFVDKPVVFQSLAGGPPRIISQDGMGLTSSPSGLSPVFRAPPSQIAAFEQLSPQSLQQGVPTFNPQDAQDAAEEAEEAAQEAQKAAEEAAEQAEQEAAEAAEAEAAAEAAAADAEAAAQAAAEAQAAADAAAQAAAADAAAQAAAEAAAAEAAALAQAAAQAAEAQAVAEAAAAQAAAEAQAAEAAAQQAAAEAAAAQAAAEAAAIQAAVENAGTQPNPSMDTPSAPTNDPTDDPGDETGGGEGEDLVGGTGEDDIPEVVGDPLEGLPGPTGVVGSPAPPVANTPELPEVDDEDDLNDDVAEVVDGNVLNLSDKLHPVIVNMADATPYYIIDDDHFDLNPSVTDVVGSLTATNDITGNDEDNAFTGGAAIDVIHGGLGNDTIIGGAGADSLYGDDGDMDIVSYATDVARDGNDLGVRVDLYSGTATDGSNSVDTLNGFNGVIGSTYDDYIRGNASGQDSLYGGAGDDTIISKGGQDSLFGGDGNDQFVFTVYPTNANSEIHGGEGDDSIYVENNSDISNMADITGIENILFKKGVASKLTVEADDFTDLINSSDSTLEIGVEGTDTLSNTGLDTLSQTLEININSTAFNVDLSNDTFTNWDITKDKLIINGSSGGDSITGADHTSVTQTINGGDGNDTLIGGQNNDTLYGGNGADNLDGGAGNDTFHYFSQSEAGDIIKGFETGDVMKFEYGGFNMCGNVESSDWVFITDSWLGNSTAGMGAGKSYFVYDDSSKTLYYDEDGVGTTEGITVATFDADSEALTGVEVV